MSLSYTPSCPQALWNLALCTPAVGCTLLCPVVPMCMYTCLYTCIGRNMLQGASRLSIPRRFSRCRLRGTTFRYTCRYIMSVHMSIQMPMHMPIHTAIHMSDPLRRHGLIKLRFLSSRDLYSELHIHCEEHVEINTRAFSRFFTRCRASATY